MKDSTVYSLIGVLTVALGAVMKIPEAITIGIIVVCTAAIVRSIEKLKP